MCDSGLSLNAGAVAWNAVGAAEGIHALGVGTSTGRERRCRIGFADGMEIEEGSE